MFRRILAGALLLLALALPAAATVNTSVNKTIVSGNGSQTQFAFSFIGVAAAYITVIYTDAGGNQTTLSQGSGATQYQISLNAPVQGAIWGVGGTVTYHPNGSPIATGTTLTIFRTLPLTQPISLQNQLSVQTLGKGSEQAVDQSVLDIQQVAEAQTRVISIPIVDPSTIVTTLPAAAVRANQALFFDASGNVGVGALPISGIISSAMQPVVNASSINAARALMGLGGPYTGGIYSNGIPAANIERQDRILVGTATLNTGTTPQSGEDWLETLIPNTTAIAQTASITPLSGIGILGASRASDNPGAAGQGVSAFQNNNLASQFGYAFYGEAWNNTTSANAAFTTSMELDIVNKNSSLVTIDPYSINPGGQTVSAWLASGGSRSGAQTASAAIAILANGAQFKSGIVFSSGALAAGANQNAISLATNYEIQWYTAPATPSATIVGNGSGGLTFGIGSAVAPAFIIDANAHLDTTSSLSPVLTSCGSGPSILGNDWAGQITTGTGATACNVAFFHSYVSQPICIIAGSGGGTPPIINTRSNTTLNFNASASTVYLYHCFGQPGG